MSTQHHRRVVHTEAIPPMVRNLDNLCPQNQTDYVKKKIDRLMSFAQVEDTRNKDALSLIQNEGMENS